MKIENIYKAKIKFEEHFGYSPQFINIKRESENELIEKLNPIQTLMLTNCCTQTILGMEKKACPKDIECVFSLDQTSEIIGHNAEMHGSLFRFEPIIKEEKL